MKTFEKFLEYKDNLFIEAKEMTTDEVVRKIKSLNLPHGGGYCGNTAIEINHKVFGGKGKYIGAANEFLFDFENEFVGHVAVKYNNQLWDTDGLISMDHLESWGQVDPTDSNYTGYFGWTEQDAYKVKIMEMTEDQIRKYLDCRN